MEGKISLLVQFDDLMRKFHSLGEDDDNDVIITVLNRMEEIRQKWCEDKELLEKQLREIEENRKIEAIKFSDENDNLEFENKELKSVISKLRYDVKCSETTLKNVRFALRKEIKEKESLKQLMSKYKENVTQATNILLEIKQTDVKKKLLPYLQPFELLDQIPEVCDTSNNSLSDLDYDKSEDEIIDLPKIPRRNQNATFTEEPSMAETDISKNQDEIKGVIAEIPNTQNRMDRTLVGYRSEVSVRPKQKPALNVSRLSADAVNITMDELSASNFSVVELRKHTFYMKKLFKPKEKCGGCKNAFNWFSTSYRCQECGAICHMECISKVPLPCIPYAHPEKDRKGRLLLIADFVQLNSVPCIPPLIVHCCLEIEKRNVKDTVYRMICDKKEAKQLMDTILKSKTGMPSITHISTTVICETVKQFLRSLDDALITLVLWRDFVRAVSLDDREAGTELVKQAIAELPIANKDTLAFIILHLKKIIKQINSESATSNLLRVFAPVIVGNSIINPAPSIRLQESKKQQEVMHSLVDIPESYWNNVLDRKSTIKASSERSLAKRSSGILIGGTRVSSGLMSPLPDYRSKIKIKPIF